MSLDSVLLRAMQGGSGGIQVRDSEEQFWAFTDNMPQLAWMADPHGVIGWYNQRWFD